MTSQFPGMKIGLSLSRCVADIARDVVAIEDVMVIIAGTNFDFTKQNEFANIKSEYDLHVWYDIPSDDITEIVKRLWYSGRIHQPRKFGGRPYTGEHHWLDLHVPPKNPVALEAFNAYRTLLALSNELEIDS